MDNFGILVGRIVDHQDRRRKPIRYGLEESGSNELQSRLWEFAEEAKA